MSLEELTDGKIMLHKGREFFYVEKEISGLEEAGEVLPAYIEKIDINILKNKLHLFNGNGETDLFFFDIETYGRGNNAPVISISYSSGINPKKVSCIFARDFTEEKFILDYFCNKVFPMDKKILTYNGSFDFSRMNMRNFNNGIIIVGYKHGNLSQIANSKHFDLYLKLARPCWKKELPKLRLEVVEKHKLKLFRKDDLPGKKIMPAYYEYVYGKEKDRYLTDPETEKRKVVRGRKIPPEKTEEKMKRLINHNLIDVASLPAILGKYCEENK
ncbi:MAG: ribonuclease H-like domain-containing protein [Candidatus Pacearchaeota archaeon]|jgi:uncharacterized protein YprB with RNaseH-like and TPR domain